MKTKIFFFAASSILLSALAFGLFFPGGTAQAAAPFYEPTSQGTPNPWKATRVPVRETLAALPTTDFAVQEATLKREQLVFSNQQTRLELSHTVAETTQAYIDSENAAGKDTTNLIKALTEFNQAISSAQVANTAAGEILANPVGFDANGQVTDGPTARQTVREAGRLLRQAHLDIKSGTLALRQAVKTYRSK